MTIRLRKPIHLVPNCCEVSASHWLYDHHSSSNLHSQLDTSLVHITTAILLLSFSAFLQVATISSISFLTFAKRRNGTVGAFQFLLRDNISSLFFSPKANIRPLWVHALFIIQVHSLGSMPLRPNPITLSLHDYIDRFQPRTFFRLLILMSLCPFFSNSIFCILHQRVLYIIWGTDRRSIWILSIVDDNFEETDLGSGFCEEGHRTDRNCLLRSERSRYHLCSVTVSMSSLHLPSQTYRDMLCALLIANLRSLSSCELFASTWLFDFVPSSPTS